MDLQNLINNQLKASRRETLSNSPQLTLGELLITLKAVPNEKGDKTVIFDFSSACPTSFRSWRGIYAEIALGFGLNGYDGDTPEKKLTDLIKDIEGAIGKTFEGWKGGDFVMDKHTPVWVDNPGNSNHTAIVGVKDNDYYVTLQTWEVHT